MAEVSNDAPPSAALRKHLRHCWQMFGADAAADLKAGGHTSASQQLRLSVTAASAAQYAASQVCMAASMQHHIVRTTTSTAGSFITS